MFGIICGLLLYHCLKCICAAGNRKYSEKSEGNNTDLTLQPNKDDHEDIVNNALYEEIPDGRYCQKTF